MARSQQAAATRGAPGAVAVVVIVALLVAASPLIAREAGTTVRVFKLHYISVKEAANAVEPLLSEQGSVTLQPRQDRISVQDRPEVIAKVAERLEIVDRKPSSYRLQVELLEGVRSSLPESVETEVDPRMRRMFPFKAYRRIGLTHFDGELGDPVEADLGEGYHLSFEAASLVTADTPWHIPNPDSRMELRTLLLELIRKPGQAPVEVVRTRVVLSENQEAFIGAAGSEDSPTGLVLILKALKVAGG